MNLNNYRVRILPQGQSGAFEFYHAETNEILLVTTNVGLDTLLRLALNDDFGV
jgi:hypothetical protein